MSQPKGSVGVALAVAVIIVIAVTSVGYYQFVLCSPSSCMTNPPATSTSGPTCAPPQCITILINFGSATLTTTAYSPDVARLVIGVNNTFQFINNDSQGGGVFHSATAKTCPQSCPFDTGVIAFNVTKGPFTITTPGTYSYYCVVHPTTMVGTIIVVAGTGGSGAPSSASSSSSASASKSSSSASVVANAFHISILKGSGNPSSTQWFGPQNATLVIGKNNTVTWTNDDSSAHTVTSTSVPNGVATFNSGIISAGQTYTMTFTVPGTYQYDCSLHLWMKGTIVVKSG